MCRLEYCQACINYTEGYCLERKEQTKPTSVCVRFMGVWEDI